jgi:ankyrin repeat protein
VFTVLLLLALKCRVLLAGATPMFYAALKGNVQVVRYLLDHGSDPAKASERGLTPLHNAAEHGVSLVLHSTSLWNGLQYLLTSGFCTL